MYTNTYAYHKNMYSRNYCRYTYTNTCANQTHKHIGTNALVKYLSQVLLSTSNPSTLVIVVMEMMLMSEKCSPTYVDVTKNTHKSHKHSCINHRFCIHCIHVHTIQQNEQYTPTVHAHSPFHNSWPHRMLVQCQH